MNQVLHRNLEDLFDAVAQQTCQHGIDREEPSLEVMHREHVAKMCGEIVINIRS